MSFQDMIQRDMAAVFLNPSEFGELRTIVCDGARYEGIPVVLTSLKQKDRIQPYRDHAQGLFAVSATLHCRLEDLGGRVPVKGCKLRIYEPGTRVYTDYYIGASACESGMLRLELEAVDE